MMNGFEPVTHRVKWECLPHQHLVENESTSFIFKACNHSFKATQTVIVQ